MVEKNYFIINEFHYLDFLMDKNEIILEKVFYRILGNRYEFDDFKLGLSSSDYEKIKLKNKVIYKTSDKIKKYLRFINGVFFEYSNVNLNVVHSFLKNRSPYSALKYHLENKYLFSTDISDFFNTIDERSINRVIREKTHSCPILDISSYYDLILNYVSVDNKLPVGFSSSPVISNSVLFEFDNALLELCKNKNITYTRYADDLIFSSNEKNIFNDFSEILKKYLVKYSEIEFSINESKTKYYHRGNKVKILGLVITPDGHISVDNKKKQDVELALHFFKNDKDKFKDYMNNNFDSSQSKLSGNLSYINSIDEFFIRKLRKKYGNYSVDFFLKNVED